jgi:leukotriene-A4 hydrolase
MFSHVTRYVTLQLRRPTAQASNINATLYKMASTKRDPTTISNYDQWRNRHITANLEIDFNKKRLTGSIDLNFDAVAGTDEIVLDTSYLDVKDVKVNGSAAKWELAPRSEPYGSPLKVKVDSSAKSVDLTVESRRVLEEKCL